MPAYYPVMLDLRQRTAVVIGDGRLAMAKAESLSQAGASVRLYTKESSGPRPFEVVPGRPTADELGAAFIIVAVTDDAGLIEWLRATVRPEQLLNIMDKPAECNFIFSSVVRRGPLTVAVSTDGTSPAMARLLRERLEAWLGTEWVEYMHLAAAARRRLKASGIGYRQRIAFFDALMASDVLPHLQAGRSAPARSSVAGLLEQFQASADDLHQELDHVLSTASR